MGKFLFTAWPFAGHLHPALSIAHALRSRGHAVAFHTGKSARTLIEGEGFRFFPFEKLDENRITKLVSSEFSCSPGLWNNIRKARHLKRKFREWLLDSIPEQLEDLERTLALWNPDALVCDLSFWAPILVLHEARPIPVAVFSVSAACMVPGPQAPLWGQGLPRPRTAIARFGNSMLRSGVRWLSHDIRTQANVHRHRFRLAPIECPVTEFAAQMPLYLVPSTPEFDYGRTDLPSSVRYVGPCLWDKPSHSAPPSWLADLPVGDPLVYVTEATIGMQDPFLLRTAALALRNEPVQVIMTTGKQRSEAAMDLGPRAPNIRVEAYVPQSDLLPKMAAMVTLGGSGGVLAALQEGIPLVIVPNDWDRPENAQRVVEAGAGLRIAVKDCTPESLRAAVKRVLTEPSFRENAHRLARAFRSSGGPAKAAELLESLVCSTAAVPA